MTYDPLRVSRVITGGHDVWTLTDRAQRIVSDHRDELALLAAAAERPVHDLTTGNPLDPGQLRTDLVRRLRGWIYADPFTGAPISLFRWIAILGEWRALLDENRGIGTISGIRSWKARSLRRFMWTDTPARRTAVPGRDKVAAIWPSRVAPAVVRAAERRGVKITRVEDGFIRSTGLGVHLTQPWSLVFDRTGIYYDPHRPSDCERILETAEFTPALLDRATALIAQLVRGGVTKYAAQRSGTIALPPARRRLLVPGQVEDDESVRLGAAGVAGNLDLLHRVRAAEPDAWIAYRPHPDVAAGLRKGHVSDADALRFADAVMRDGTMADVLDQVDGVHVLTSLAGFEALLRGRRVVTHGQPFYAGWGLTDDRAGPVDRRRRRLTLPQLVAGVLILYPRYIDPVTKLPCPVEILVQRCLAAAGPAHVRKPAAPRAGPRDLDRAKTVDRDGGMTDRPAAHFLFLQGPPGPFFSQLAQALRAAGHRCSRINCHGGDWLDWRGRAENFRRDIAHWPASLGAFLDRQRVSDIVLFGDCRPLHALAIAIAAPRDIDVHVFEEGYIRPDWVTLERGGVNGHSRLRLDAPGYLHLAAGLPPVPACPPIPASFRQRASAALSHYLASYVLAPCYPGYRSHRPARASTELAGWIARGMGRPAARWRATRTRRRIATQPYVLVPLQLDSDYQIRIHSPFADMAEAITSMLASFARHAPPSLQLVIKEHPLDNGLRNWRRIVRDLARRAGVADRVAFLQHGDIHRLVAAAAGVVTVNSTTGTLAAAAGTPVVVLGTAVYDLPGVTHQGGLDSFWTAPTPPQLDIYEAFRRVLIARCLLRGGFSNAQARAALLPRAIERLCAPRQSGDAVILRDRMRA